MYDKEVTLDTHRHRFAAYTKLPFDVKCIRSFAIVKLYFSRCIIHLLARCLRQESDTGYAISILSAMIAMPLPVAKGEGQREVHSSREAARSEGHAHKRDIRPLSSSLRFSDGTKESGVLYAVRLASADDSPRPPSLSYGQVISDNGLHRCVYDRQDCKRGSGAHE